MTSNSFFRGSHQYQRNPQLGLQGVNTEHAGVPESSLLFSIEAPWAIQVVSDRGETLKGMARMQMGYMLGSNTVEGSRRVWIEKNQWSAAVAPAGQQAEPSRMVLSPLWQAHTMTSFDRRFNDTLVGGLLAPPRLVQQRPIFLPFLSSNHPVMIHQMLAYQPHQHFSSSVNAPIQWNMTCPPSAARLATSFNAYDTTTSHWSHENALEPATMPSLTIRIASIERPIVVFPSEMDRSVHIADVLDAVYVALRFEALEDQRRSRSGRFSATIANVGWIGAGTSIGDPSAEGSEIAYAIRRFYNGDVWWNGMHESVEERDVWILELRVARGVWY